MGSSLGISDEKILALADYATSPLYSEVERVTLEYADSMTITGREVSDDFFARLRQFYNDDELVELTEIIAWENASSKFNRALRIPSQKLWRRKGPQLPTSSKVGPPSCKNNSLHHSYFFGVRFIFLRRPLA